MRLLPKILMMNYLRKIKQLKSIEGYIIFVAIGVSCVNLMITTQSWLSVSLFLLFTRRLIKSRQLVLIMSCLFVMIGYSSFFLWQVSSKTAVPMSNNLSEQTLILRVAPTTIKINGDRAQAIGKSILDNQTYQVSYRIESESTKTKLSEIENYFVIKGSFILSSPAEKRNKGTFDYKRYLKQQGISQIAELKMVQKIMLDTWHTPWEYLTLLRVKIKQYVTEQFEVTTASYIKSLILGVKDDDFQKSKDILSQLGIMHFFSISGFHLFFFLTSFHYIYLRLGGIKDYLVGVDTIFLVSFAILTGFSTSVLRSTLYIWLLTCSKRFGNRLTPLDCWSLTLISCLVINPYLLLQAGGQLSFALTFFILYLKPITGRIKNKIWRSCYFSLVISIFSVPIIAYNFFEWHLISLILTLILIPIFSCFLMPTMVIMLCSHHMISIEFWNNTVESLLNRFDKILAWLASSSPGHVVTGQFPIYVFSFCVLLTMYWLAIAHKKKYSSLLVLLLILITPSTFKYVNPVGAAIFVDVGQGDSFLLRLPFNKGAMMIDVGGQRMYKKESWQEKIKSYSKAEYSVIPLLKSLGITQLDSIFITHGHEDHYGDLEKISHYVKIKNVIFSNGSEQSSNFKEQLNYLSHHGTQIERTLAPNNWLVNKHLVTSLYPFKRGDGGNNNSLVLTFVIKDKKFLMTGDLEKEGETELLTESSSLQANILKVGHHGSKTSTSELFLEAVSPNDVIISCGENNKFGHPNEEVLQRLRQRDLTIYRTDQQGMIVYQWYPWSKKLRTGKTMIESD